MYQHSIEDPQTFFGEQAEGNLAWIEPFTSIHIINFLILNGLRVEKSISPITVSIGI